MDQPIAIGSYVLYGKTGVCLVQEQKTVTVGGVSGQYYVLQPISDSRSSVFVPCDNAALVERMRALLTRGEIDALLSVADSEQLAWVDERAQRMTLERSIINSGDRRMLIRLLCCLLRKKQERLDQGKRLSTMDETTLQECMRLIDEEFSMVLGIDRSQVAEYILARL